MGATETFTAETEQETDDGIQEAGGLVKATMTEVDIASVLVWTTMIGTTGAGETGTETLIGNGICQGLARETGHEWNMTGLKTI